MSNVVHLEQRRRKPVPRSRPIIQPAPGALDKHLRALEETIRLGDLVLMAGGLSADPVLESAFIVCLHEAFKGTNWKVRFERVPQDPAGR